MSLRIETNERLYMTRQVDEVVEALFSTVHFDYSEVEHRGRLLDVPEAWSLVGIRYNHDQGEVTLVFGLSEADEVFA